MTEAIFKEMKAVLLLWVAYQDDASYEKYTKAMNATYKVLAKLEKLK